MEPQSSPKDNADATATFRKPVNDAGNRIYRRRSPQDGSSSSDGGPLDDQNSSPIRPRKDPEKGTDDRRRKDDGRALDRDSGRSHYGRSGESYRHSDRQSSRGSRGYHRHGDYHRRDKYAGEDDRDYSRSRSGRDPRNNSYSDHSRRESEYRSRDHRRDDDKYSRDKSDGLVDRNRDREREKDPSSEYQKHSEKDFPSDRAGSGRRHTNSSTEDVKYGERDRYNMDKVGLDEKIDHRRSSGDYKSDHVPAYEGSRDHRNDSASRRDSSGHRQREVGQSDIKPFDSENYTREEKKNSDGKDRNKEHHPREPGKLHEDGNSHFSKDEESLAKKPKLLGCDGSSSDGTSSADAVVKQSLSSKQAQEVAGQGFSEQACLTDSDIDAAKVAAMKAAELVNRNLIGTGIMSADQKKKLLWGNKKTTAKEESANRWDNTMFGDRERQEKFNKLMSLRLHWYLWPIVGCEGRNERGAEARQRGCGEAEGATPVGFREAIYCWITSKRWSHCWSGSLKPYLVYNTTALISSIFLYNLWVSEEFIDVALACIICDSRLKFFSMMRRCLLDAKFPMDRMLFAVLVLLPVYLSQLTCKTGPVQIQ